MGSGDVFRRTVLQSSCVAAQLNKKRFEAQLQTLDKLANGEHTSLEKLEVRLMELALLGYPQFKGAYYSVETNP